MSFANKSSNVMEHSVLFCDGLLLAFLLSSLIVMFGVILLVVIVVLMFFGLALTWR